MIQLLCKIIFSDPFLIYFNIFLICIYLKGKTLFKLFINMLTIII